MEIYIGKITFENAGNSGGSEITAPCYITEDLKGYSNEDTNKLFKSLNDSILLTNKLYNEGVTKFSNYKSTLIYAPVLYMSSVNSSVFDGCAVLEFVPRVYGPDNMSLSNWFAGCTNLKRVNLSDNNIGNGYKCFYNLKNLTYVDLTNCDFSNCTKTTSQLNTLNSMFYNNSALVDVIMIGAILPKTNITSMGLDSCNALSVDSLVSILNALPTGSYTIKLGSTNLAKLSDEQKAIATNKGWTLS